MHITFDTDVRGEPVALAWRDGWFCGDADLLRRLAAASPDGTTCPCRPAVAVGLVEALFGRRVRFAVLDELAPAGEGSRARGSTQPVLSTRTTPARALSEATHAST